MSDITNGQEQHNHAYNRRFIGRTEELDAICALLANNDCVSVVGSRCIGKSMLLQLLHNRELQHPDYDLTAFIFIPLNITDYQQGSQESFFVDACKQILTHCQPRLGEYEYISTDWPMRFRDVLQHIKKHGLHPVIIMDAFDKVASNVAFDNRFFSFLRSLYTRGSVTYVTASIKPLSEICHKSVQSSPFFNAFTECPLGPLTLKEAEELITLPTQNSPNQFTTDDVQWIMQLAGRHPLFLSCVSKELFDAKLRTGSGSINREDVRERAEKKLIPIFERIWDSFSEEQSATKAQIHLSQEQQTLKEEARRRSSTSRQRKIPELSESALFRLYIYNRFNIGEPDITPDDIKKVLKHLEDIEYLGNSKLAETNYVTIHYERSLPSVPVKKGTIVSELVKKAHKLMGPGGARNDTVEWRSYNILFYHYFKYYLTSDQISARLGIGSKRGFFRIQKKAIELLCEKICALEADSLHDQ